MFLMAERYLGNGVWAQYFDKDKIILKNENPYITRINLTPDLQQELNNFITYLKILSNHTFGGKQ